MRKFVKLKKQRGAVMMEAAYVLPLILITILFIFDAVRYTTATFSANSILWDLHKQIENDKNARAASASFVSNYVSCNAGKIEMSTGPNDIIKNMVTASMQAEGYDVQSTTAQITLMPNTSGMGALKLYSIKFTAQLSSIIVPDTFMMNFPVTIYDLISFNQDCS